MSGASSKQAAAALAALLAVAGCSSKAGGGFSPPPAVTNPVSGSTLVHPVFHLRVPKRHEAAGKGKHPSFIPASTQSVQVVLNSINGNSPPASLATPVVTNVNSITCNNSCTVAAPAAPPGNDSYTLTIFDAQNALGHTLATATQVFTITPGSSNTNTVTLEGVPASFAIAGVPAGTAGTPFGAPTAITVTVLDAAGDTITGTYLNSVTVSDSDVTGATHLSVNGATPATSVTLTKNTDVMTLAYSGLAISPATLHASATGASAATSTFSPSLSTPSTVCNGGGVGDTTECGTAGGGGPQINLYATAGTGSTATFTTSLVGWTGAPYSQNISQSNDCAGVATIALTSSTGTFTATQTGSGASGATCHVTLTGGAGPQQIMPLTYTETSVIGNGKHRTRRAIP